jgi:uncharacterized repeat protein (TIGR01451 family)
MRILALTSVALIILISAGVNLAWSQEKGAVELKAVAETEVEVVNDDGQKEIKRVPAAKVVPGDVVIYTIYYTNNGSEPAENFVITNPVPEHTIYLDGSAEGENTQITFSVDDGNSYDTGDKLLIADAEGKKKAATPADYTHIRWALNEPVPTGATGFVYFKAQLK